MGHYQDTVVAFLIIQTETNKWKVAFRFDTGKFEGMADYTNDKSNKFIINQKNVLQC